MPRKKTKKSKQKRNIKRQAEKKYTVNNEHFFPTLVSVKKGHDEVVKQQIRLEKAKKLREFSWKYYRLQFSEDATLEKMLRSLKLSGITAPQELGGPAKKPPKVVEDNRALLTRSRKRNHKPLRRADSMAYFLTRVHKRVHFLKVLTRIVKKTPN